MTWVSGLQLLGGSFYTAGGGNKRRFAEQINTVIMAVRGNKVVNGCASTPIGAVILTDDVDHLTVASGDVLIAGTLLSFAGGNINLYGAQGGLILGESRYVLITIYNNAGTATLKATNGTIATDTNQEPYEAIEDEVGVCIVYLTFSDTTLDVNQIGDWKIFTEDGFALKDDGLFYFGNDGDFQLSYDSANAWLQLGDGTNDFLRITDLGTYPEFDFFGNLDVVDHDLSTKGLKLAGTLVTASATELNLLDDNLGIGLNNLVEIAIACADNDYAKFTATGLEGRTYAEVKTDLSLDNVDNVSINSWAGSSNILIVGIIGTGTWQGTAIADAYIASAVTWDAKQDALTFGLLSGNVLKSEEALTSNDILLAGTAQIKGRTYSELKTDLGLVFGTISNAPNIDQHLLTTSNVQFAQITFGGNLISAASRQIQLNAASHTTLIITNTNASYQANLSLEGDFDCDTIECSVYSASMNSQNEDLVNFICDGTIETQYYNGSSNSWAASQVNSFNSNVVSVPIQSSLEFALLKLTKFYLYVSDPTFTNTGITDWVCSWHYSINGGSSWTQVGSAYTITADASSGTINFPTNFVYIDGSDVTGDILITMKVTTANVQNLDILNVGSWNSYYKISLQTP